MECIPFACPSCGARMYFVQETKATTYDMWLFSETMEVRFIKNFHLVRPCFRNRFSKLKSKPVPSCCALFVEASTLTPVKVNHIIHLRGDDYQKIRIIKNDQVYYEGEVRYENGTIEELENAQVKHWSVDNGVLVLEIK